MHAWSTSDRSDIEAVVDGWQSRDDWQKNGWTFDWEILLITGDTSAVRGRGTYVEFGAFDNLWTLPFSPDGRVKVLRMWNNQAEAG